MYLDERTEFADANSAVLAIGAALVGDVIDLRPATISPNLLVDLEGSELYLVIQVDTTFVGATSTTQFELASDTTADLNTARTTHFLTGAIPVASLVAGFLVCAIPLPSGSYKRFLGIRQIVATANVTAGKINAFLTKEPALYRALADNVA